MKLKSTSLLVVSVLAGMTLLASCGGSSSSASTGGSDPLSSSQNGGTSNSLPSGDITKSAALQILSDINDAHSKADFKADKGKMFFTKTGNMIFTTFG